MRTMDRLPGCRPVLRKQRRAASPASLQSRSDAGSVNSDQSLALTVALALAAFQLEIEWCPAVWPDAESQAARGAQQLHQRVEL